MSDSTVSLETLTDLLEDAYTVHISGNSPGNRARCSAISEIQRDLFDKLYELWVGQGGRQDGLDHVKVNAQAKVEKRMKEAELEQIRDKIAKRMLGASLKELSAVDHLLDTIAMRKRTLDEMEGTQQGEPANASRQRT